MIIASPLVSNWGLPKNTREQKKKLQSFKFVADVVKLLKKYFPSFFSGDKGFFGV
jgi:hypothetical protein